MTSIQPKTTENGSFDLEQPEIKTDKTADDCISRSQAIEAFEPTHYMDWYTPTIIETLEALPSAQQEIIRCKDCKWFGGIGCAIRIVDDSDKPKEEDFCSFAER